jgi:6-phosphogluconolactonase
MTGSVGTGINPVALLVNSASSLLFAANQGSDNISVFSIQPDGSLTSASGSPFPTLAEPVALAVSPNGKYLYVTNSISGTVSVYSVGSSGSLTPLPNSPFTGQNASLPNGIAVSSDGKFVYVANFGSNNISVFTACTAVSTLCPIADGSLLEVPFSPFALGIGNGTGPGPMVIDPTGNYLFVLDTTSNQISEFHISITMIDALTSTASLIAAIPETIATGTGPTSIVIHPTGRWLYTANYKASTVTVYYFDELAGTLTPSTIPFVTSGQPAALAVR